ncbi:bifunctional GNAT family N-acetyltransferase/acetate--CoA ligase family protein [Actinomycetospora termitidis]|uniref:Bifunctional GNAT family N-acetyltransferase/acetate--CoA ligase family protein n=1 Tax=Actinomycetospora termitidis TaxID=3053470 RepID=A0ABT7M726_9PSEU|nr:bifunctional GNAT family N-acetyltransferase/acetate--CoA ligase family protein [Actinomycetospora sp. Odt1-22]MDL5156455.1 bifunctional GNAT family N-acetyltransferase/acetate--CoA ligase family protein [Actinomycetospora sp. Odt1-22]
MSSSPAWSTTEVSSLDAATTPVLAVPDAPYPRHWEADVVAADGVTAHLRPITPDDADDVVAFHARLSERTRYYRYFSPYPTIPARDLKRFVEVDQHDSVALVLWLATEIIAIGRYVRLGADDPSAEVAFVVRDDHQGRGLGSILLEHLAAAAEEVGISRFVAEVLSENRAMVHTFRQAGYDVTRSLDGSTLHLEFDVAATDRSTEVRRSREQAAEARSVANVLHPRSVAVVGASVDESKLGHVVLRNLLLGGFTGPVYPVNPEARSVRGVRAYPTVGDIPDEVDLAVLAVPPEEVAGVVDGCLTKGVKALVVVTTGFGETGEAGIARQRELVASARARGMRVVGPSALGVVNLDPATRLNASLAPTVPPPGRVGFFCQSGALGIQILAAAAQRRLGLSTFVSAGNRADLSGNDLMQYWDTDPATDVVLLYLESFGNPRKFARVARRLARRKPVVAVASGRHATPGLAASTSPLEEASVAAVFDQSGVIRVNSVDELFDVALLVANQPLPRGPRIGVVGNSSALGVLASDVALAHGMHLAFPPVDVGAMADPAELADAALRALEDDACDALVIVFSPPVATDGAAHADALAEVVTSADKPVTTTFLASSGVPEHLAVPSEHGGTAVPARGSVPSYPSPERAVIALARVVRYTQWLERPVGDFVVPPGCDLAAARAFVDELGPIETALVLDDDQTADLLGRVGIRVAPFRRARTKDEAVQAAAALRASASGGEVVVKTVVRTWRHRSDLAGVRTGLSDDESVAYAYQQLADLSGSPEVDVQVQVPPGMPVVVELRDDPSFGSLVSFGLAGVVTELLGDRAYRATPLSTMDAHTLVRAPRAAPMLDGYRGARPMDLGALEDLLLRVGQLADHVPELRSLVLDPVLVAERGVHPTSVRAVLGPPPGPRDGGPRRLGG